MVLTKAAFLKIKVRIWKEAAIVVGTGRNKEQIQNHSIFNVTAKPCK